MSNPKEILLISKECGQYFNVLDLFHVQTYVVLQLGLLTQLLNQ